MKPISTCLVLLFALSFCKAQNKGKINSLETRPKAGIENHYLYLPPKGLLLPKKLQALVIYESNNEFYSKLVPASKADKGYNFSFKSPDSIAVLIVSMADGKEEVLSSNSLEKPKKKIVDNNNGKGFVIYLHNKNGKRFNYENITLARLLSGYAMYMLDLNPVPGNTIIKLYEEAYSLYPKLTKENSYPDYLAALYNEKSDTVKPQLLAYANEMLLVQNDEIKWLNAKDIYGLLKMADKKQLVNNKILVAYPNGLLAEGIYWQNFHNQKEPTEQSALAAMDEYIYRFKDSTGKTKDKFYQEIVPFLIKKQEWNSLLKYNDLIRNKLIIPYNYNYFAWVIADNPGNNSEADLQNATMLSKKSLDYLQALMKNPAAVYEYDENLQSVQNMFINTYALIQYRLGHYDSAFYYQDAIYKQGSEFLDVQGFERYAMYAEKVKGDEYARGVLEQQLLSGVNSPLMLKQLMAIYKKLNLPEAEFNNLQKKNDLLTQQKTEQAIIAKLGSTKAKNFTLKNILGQEISLSSFRNKVVVLDFWATWCTPCRASFPAMQELVNKFKNDPEIVFLFIDVWEHKTDQKMKEAAIKIMKNDNYSFNVLLDVNDKVVKDYRVEAIPAKFVIDKKGNIVFMGETTNDFSTIIEAAKK